MKQKNPFVTPFSGYSYLSHFTDVSNQARFTDFYISNEFNEQPAAIGQDIFPGFLKSTDNRLHFICTPMLL
jgi:hypothetical protein